MVLRCLLLALPSGNGAGAGAAAPPTRAAPRQKAPCYLALKIGRGCNARPWPCLCSPGAPASAVKHPLLKRQARMDYSLDSTVEDPWVRISDCIKNLFSPIMSENHGHVPLPSTVGLGEEVGVRGHPDRTPSKPDAAGGAPKAYKSADGGTVKKGPPVAPKPAWFRQSLKSLRTRAQEPRRPPDTASPTQPTPAPRERPGPPTRTFSSSIKQRISSFETFGSSPLPSRGAQRQSLQASWGKQHKLRGNKREDRVPAARGEELPPPSSHNHQSESRRRGGPPAPPRTMSLVCQRRLCPDGSRVRKPPSVTPTLSRGCCPHRRRSPRAASSRCRASGRGASPCPGPSPGR